MWTVSKVLLNRGDPMKGAEIGTREAIQQSEHLQGSGLRTGHAVESSSSATYRCCSSPPLSRLRSLTFSCSLRRTLWLSGVVLFTDTGRRSWSVGMASSEEEEDVIAEGERRTIPLLGGVSIILNFVLNFSWLLGSMFEDLSSIVVVFVIGFCEGRRGGGGGGSLGLSKREGLHRLGVLKAKVLKERERKNDRN